MLNKKFYLSTFLGFAATAFIVGCNSGNPGSIQTSGQRCKEDGSTYNPVPLETASTKVAAKAEDGLPWGTYTYAGSEIYYYNKDTGMQVYLKEDAPASASIVCVRGIPKGTTTAVVDGKVGVSSFVVSKGGIDFKTRAYNFTFDAQKLSMQFVDQKSSDFKSIEDVYSAKKGSQFQFYKTSDTTYESRSSETVGNIRKDIVVRYTYKKPLPPT